MDPFSKVHPEGKDPNLIVQQHAASQRMTEADEARKHEEEEHANLLESRPELQDLLSALTNEKARSYFRLFLSREFNVENITFWEAVYVGERASRSNTCRDNPRHFRIARIAICNCRIAMQ